ncbi:MAG: alpha/beta hydrolase [Dehalococcoidia bacterium]|nr:alpha/beta hydrolase [Dehalococcoidia bacterium]
MPLVRAGDVELEYFETGPADASDATPLAVLVHGASSSSRIWETVQQRLAEAGVRSVAISTLGAGASSQPEEPARYAPASYARDLAAALDTLGLRRFTLVGHSLGTLVSRYYVRDHAERVDALVLMAGPDPARAALTPEQQAQRASRAGAEAPETPTDSWQEQHQGLSAETRDALWSDIRANPPQRMRGQASPWPGLEGEAPKIPVHTLVVCGDADDVVAPEVAVRGYLELDATRRHLHVFHGVGHFPNAQAPDRLAGVLARFVRGYAGE